MTARLLPCPACARHVRIIESYCPFCGNTLPLAYQSAGPVVLPKRRLGRAAIAAFGAAAIMSSGCGGDDSSTTDSSVTLDSSMADSAAGDTGTADSAMADAMADAAADATSDTAVTPAYGAPADVGPADAMDDGAVMNLYGAPPEP